MIESEALPAKSGLEALPLPQPINPQEVCDIEAQFPGRIVRDINHIWRVRAAAENVRAGLAGERGDEASVIREQHRAELEAKAVCE